MATMKGGMGKAMLDIPEPHGNIDCKDKLDYGNSPNMVANLQRWEEQILVKGPPPSRQTEWDHPT